MARLSPAEQIQQSYDLAMMALADYLTQERDATATVDALIRILDRDNLRDALTEVLVDARVHPRPGIDISERSFDRMDLRPRRRLESIRVGGSGPVLD
jgi:hypothetical protein